jgi:hypothetical protein
MEKLKHPALAYDPAADLQAEGKSEQNQQGDFEQPREGRTDHIMKRIDRSQYKQWERNLRSKMRAWVK